MESEGFRVPVVEIFFERIIQTDGQELPFVANARAECRLRSSFVNAGFLVADVSPIVKFDELPVFGPLEWGIDAKFRIGANVLWSQACVDDFLAFFIDAGVAGINAAKTVAADGSRSALLKNAGVVFHRFVEEFAVADAECRKKRTE